MSRIHPILKLGGLRVLIGFLRRLLGYGYYLAQSSKSLLRVRIRRLLVRYAVFIVVGGHSHR